MGAEVKEDPFHLRPVWDALLDVYQAFAEVCESNGLRYYMTDGNALGAVRHHGFIPWDDDLDVSMPRPDYEKFLQIADRELPSHFKVVTWRNTPEFNSMFAKIQDSRREKIEDLEKRLGWQMSNGIFIDIFPIDGYPDGKLAQWMYIGRVKLLLYARRYYMEHFATETRKGKFAWFFGMMVSKFYPGIHSGADCFEAANRLNASHTYGKTRLSGRSATTMWKRYILPYTVYGDPTWVEFDKIKVPLPHDYDTWLNYDYPNYMKLPPKEKQHPTHGYAYRVAWWLGPTKEN